MKKKTAEIRHTQRFTEYYKDGKLYFPDSTEKLLFAIYGETAGITTEHLDYDELIEIITYRTEKELSEKVREIQEEYRQWEGDNVEYFHAVKTKDGLSDNVSSLRTDIVRALAGKIAKSNVKQRQIEEMTTIIELVEFLDEYCEIMSSVNFRGYYAGCNTVKLGKETYSVPRSFSYKGIQFEIYLRRYQRKGKKYEMFSVIKPFEYSPNSDRVDESYTMVLRKIHSWIKTNN